MTDAPPIRVLLADDQHLIRGGLRAIIDTEPDMRVVGEASDGASAAREAVTTRADVVLMDVQMPGVDGIDGVRLVIDARPEARVLMLTMFDLDDYVLRALRAGASGFLLKTTPPAELTAAIRASQSGAMLFAPSVTRRLVESYVKQPPTLDGIPERLAPLTPRELDVFEAIARGLSNSEIGAKLYMGEATVKTHVTRILSKLGLRDRVQAVVLAYDCGVMRPATD
ncbi:response regulator transcription factor [Microbacterium sp. BK668]|uniref:response regulator n=1 Tax=Microbacterium sp. BK668 TaxID=2512118 RepID=UPI0010DEAED1|nr:response regulator transcription factor [Microbacterium sp. BK668]TDN91926.1 LuxR family two component transcriptional regulator [Microbacterium sp. BK668]